MAKYALLDGSTVVNIIVWDGNTATYNPAPLTAVLYDPAIHVVTVKIEDQNRATLQQQAATALVNNRTYVALASPTTAQSTAQVKALTQQVNVIIRLLLQQFDATN